MNIIYHHRTQGKGVEGIHITSIVKALRDLGHEVFLVSPPGCDPTQPMQQGNKQIASRKSGLRVLFSLISRYCPEAIFEMIELLYNIPAYISLRKKVKQKPIQLIYERYFLFSIASTMIAWSHRIPLVLEVNDSSFVPRLRRLAFTRLAQYIEKRVFSRANHIITVSKRFKRILTDQGIKEKTIRVCHNAIDPEIFNTEKIEPLYLGIPKSHVVIGFVGLFVKWIGLDQLVEIFGRIKQKHPDIHLLLVGGGPEEDIVRQIVSEHHLEKNVTITGIVPHDAIPAHINQMDICIIPRHEKYTSPVKLFEYMAMAKAVLVPSYASIQEVVIHGENGMLFDPDNGQSLIDGLELLLKDSELRKTLGKNARQFVLQNNTWEKNARQILMLQNNM